MSEKQRFGDTSASFAISSPKVDTKFKSYTCKFGYCRAQGRRGIFQKSFVSSNIAHIQPLQLNILDRIFSREPVDVFKDAVNRGCCCWNALWVCRFTSRRFHGDKREGGKGHGKTVEGSFVGWTNSQGVKTVVCTVDEVLKYSLRLSQLEGICGQNLQALPKSLIGFVLIRFIHW